MLGKIREDDQFERLHGFIDPVCVLDEVVAINVQKRSVQITARKSTPTISALDFQCQDDFPIVSLFLVIE
jgi:hypothetical protein